MHGLFLPLHRVARALEEVRAGRLIQRGSLCTTFTYTAFPECARLGVAKPFIQERVLDVAPPKGGTFSMSIRPGGMLKVKCCIPGSVASSQLQPGDVVLELNGQPCVDFVQLDSVLDSNVSCTIRLLICRMGDQVEVNLPVDDLTTMIPREFLELGLGVFHRVGYHTAQKYHVPLKGVYIAQAGFIFGESLKSDAVISSINGVACEDLKSFEDLLTDIPDNEYFSVTWMGPKSCQERQVRDTVVKMQRKWYPFKAWGLDSESRLWSSRLLASNSPDTKVDAELEETLGNKEAEPSSKRRRTTSRGEAFFALESSVCSVRFRASQHFDMDIIASGQDSEADVTTIIGAGVIVDSEHGYVLTDRGTVPQAMGDIEVTLGTLSCSAYVWFMHPIHSIVVLKLTSGNPKFGTAAVFEEKAFEAGDDADFVGVSSDGQCFQCQVKVEDVQLASFPSQWPIRWREQNLEAVSLVDDPTNARGGVLSGTNGHIHAVYCLAAVQQEEESVTFGYCIPTHALLPLIQHIRGSPGQPVDVLKVPSLEVTLGSTDVQKLRRLPARLRPSVVWLKRLAARNRSVLKVNDIASGGPCDGVLKQGDLVVKLCGEAVACAEEVEAQLQNALRKRGAPDGPANDQTSLEVAAEILRQGKELEVRISVRLLGTDTTCRFCVWHGLILREIPRALQAFAALPPGVHVAQTMLGSPAEASGIEGDIIVAVDGTPMSSLDAILASDRARLAGLQAAGSSSVAGRKSHLRVESVSVSGQRFMATLDPDLLFWPTFHISQGKSGIWSCMEQTP